MGSRTAEAPPGSRPDRGRRPPAAKLALSAAVLALLLALGEIGLRAAGYEPLETPRGGSPEIGLVLQGSRHPLLSYELRPNSRGRLWDTQVEINSHGLRGREIGLAKPPGMLRIAALGDSVTFGNQLPREATWPEVLERHLAAGEPPGGEVEVLNLGVAGYNTLEEVARLEHTGLAFEPDLVVVAYHVNDLAGAMLTAETVERFRRRMSPLYRLRLAQFVRVKLDEREVIEGARQLNLEQTFAEEYGDSIADISGDGELGALMGALTQRLASRSTLPPRYGYLPWYTSSERVGRLRFAFEWLTELSRVHGFRVLVVILPCQDEAGLVEEHELLYAIAIHEAARAGFEVLGPLERLRRGGRWDLSLDPWHPNERGQQLLALAIAGRLEELGWVPPRAR